VDLSLPEICALAQEFQVAGIELRGIAGRMDMPEYCAEHGFTPERVGEISRGNQTQLVLAGSSVKLCSATEKDRAELLTFGKWAESLGMRYVRVFGGGTWGQAVAEADYAHGVETLKWWRRERADRGWKVDLILETHDAFSASEPCLNFLRRVPEGLNLIWDTHHTWRLGGELPEVTWRQLGPFVSHIHIKDSVDRPSARHSYTYILPGDGQMPLTELMALLERENFDGFISLEWERHWHPYLPVLRQALGRMVERKWFASSRGKSLTVSSVRCDVSPSPGAYPKGEGESLPDLRQV
jgi:sugar phosphate isomerase/epimerase